MQRELSCGRGLTKTALQFIAIVAMITDHCAMFATHPLMYYAMKFVGRTTIVIMCYFVAEGFHRTHDLRRYIIRMAIFAAISQIPYYVYIRFGAFPNDFMSLAADIFRHRNVIFNLFVGLCLLTVLKSDYSFTVKIISIFAAFRLAKYSDWGYYAVLWITGFGLFYDSKKRQMMWLAAVLLIRMAVTATEPVVGIINTRMLTYASLCSWLTNFGGVIPLLLLPMYNGERGNMPKLTWYVFYPLQFIVISIIGMIVFC